MQASVSGSSLGAVDVLIPAFTLIGALLGALSSIKFRQSRRNNKEVRMGNRIRNGLKVFCLALVSTLAGMSASIAAGAALP